MVAGGPRTGAPCQTVSSQMSLWQRVSIRECLAESLKCFLTSIIWNSAGLCQIIKLCSWLATLERPAPPRPAAGRRLDPPLAMPRPWPAPEFLRFLGFLCKEMAARDTHVLSPRVLFVSLEGGAPLHNKDRWETQFIQCGVDIIHTENAFKHNAEHVRAFCD